MKSQNINGIIKRIRQFFRFLAFWMCLEEKIHLSAKNLQSTSLGFFYVQEKIVVSFWTVCNIYADGKTSLVIVASSQHSWACLYATYQSALHSEFVSRWSQVCFSCHPQNYFKFFNIFYLCCSISLEVKKSDHLMI